MKRRILTSILVVLFTGLVSAMPAEAKPEKTNRRQVSPCGSTSIVIIAGGIGIITTVIGIATIIGGIITIRNQPLLPVPDRRQLG